MPWSMPLERTTSPRGIDYITQISSDRPPAVSGTYRQLSIDLTTGSILKKFGTCSEDSEFDGMRVDGSVGLAYLEPICLKRAYTEY